MPTDYYERVLHYQGDQRGAVGTLVGPTTTGEMLVIDRVDFDPERSRSTAFLRLATTHDVAGVTFDGQRWAKPVRATA